MKKNLALAPHAPNVGCRVCLGCLPPKVTKYGHPKFKPFPHSFVEGVCVFKAPGVRWKPVYEPGEEEAIMRDKRRKGREEVPF